MRYIIRINALLCAMLLLATGCRMTDAEYDKWKHFMEREDVRLKSEIEAKELQKKELEKEKARMEADKAFLEGKSKVLARENATLDETWDGMGADSHEVMMSLFSRIHDSEMAFYNVRLGNPPDKMAETMVSEKVTILVDMERTVQENSHIQMGELYASKKVKGRTPSVCFIVLAKNSETGKYYVRSSSGDLPVNSEGLNRFSFTDRPLEAKEGDRYGIILKQGASIDYERLDTGGVCVRTMDAMPDQLSKLALVLDENPQKRGKEGPGSMEMALMVRGTSDRKSMFIVDGRRFFKENGMLTKVVVEIKASAPKPMPVYFAVLGEAPLKDYVLRDISPIAMVTPGEPKEILLPHLKKEDGHETFIAHKGDLFALLMPGLTDMSKVKADFGIFKTVEPFDYSKPYFRKTLAKMKRESDEPIDMSQDVVFVSFKVE
ncbi:MAG: hypothetical protein IJS15_12895 [Victivallales bacterium]|nr:hypothetical protein [Victivallales bacterium]